MIGSIGGPEIFLILVVALLLFGPRRLPELGRTFGKTMSQFRRAAADFRGDLEREIRVEKIRETEKTLQSIGRDVTSVDEIPSSGAPPDAAAGTPEPSATTPRDDRPE